MSSLSLIKFQVAVNDGDSLLPSLCWIASLKRPQKKADLTFSKAVLANSSLRRDCTTIMTQKSSIDWEEFTHCRSVIIYWSTTLRNFLSGYQLCNDSQGYYFHKIFSVWHLCKWICIFFNNIITRHIREVFLKLIASPAIDPFLFEFDFDFCFIIK